MGVYRGGAVYRCDIAADDRCDIIHFDDKGKIIGDSNVATNMLSCRRRVSREILSTISRKKIDTKAVEMANH